MSHKNAVFSRRPHIRTAVTKMTGHAFFKLSTFLSLAVVIQISGWNQAIHALDLNNLTQPTSNIQRGLNFLNSDQNSTSLRQIFRLLAFTTKSQAVESEATPAQINKFEENIKPEPISPVSKPKLQTYRVKWGDTIYQIASRYQVSVRELIELNQIQNPNLISVDRELRIPSSEQSAIANNSLAKSEVDSSKKPQPLKPKSKSTSESSVEEDPYISELRAEIDELRAQYKQTKLKKSISDSTLAIESENQLEESTQETLSTEESNTPGQLAFESNLSKVDTIALTLPPLINEEYLPSAFDGYTWPAEGVLTSGYGRRWGRMHRGIDIAAPFGTPIVAAAAGKVIGAGWHRGYGNLVKLEHLDGSITYYAHVNRILVTHDQRVKQGEIIAEMGSTGRSTGPHLHFEIHLNDRSVINPLAVLDQR